MADASTQPMLAPRRVIHALRGVASFALLGTVTAGALFGWAPALGGLSVHELGAIVGAAVGVATNVKPFA